MGACCSNTENQKKDRRSSMKQSNRNMKVDQIPDSSVVMENDMLKHDSETPIKSYLVSGNTRMIQEMISRREINPNEYIFSSGDRTILHEAVLVSDSPQLIETILNNKADVNALEKQTGNTALFFASLDLKDEIVKTILKFNPNINIKNEKGQTIFDFLNENLVEKKGTKKTELTPEQTENLSNIIDLLKDYKQKFENVEDLDEDERRAKNPLHDESGPKWNRI